MANSIYSSPLFLDTAGAIFAHGFCYLKIRSITIPNTSGGALTINVKQAQTNVAAGSTFTIENQGGYAGPRRTIRLGEISTPSTGVIYGNLQGCIFTQTAGPQTKAILNQQDVRLTLPDLTSLAAGAWTIPTRTLFSARVADGETFTQHYSDDVLGWDGLYVENVAANCPLIVDVAPGSWAQVTTPSGGAGQ